MRDRQMGKTAKEWKTFLFISGIEQNYTYEGHDLGQPARRMELPSSCGARWPSL